VRFQWDKNKNRRNLAKHGLSFAVAIKAFDDPAAEYEFNSIADGEYREHVTGRVIGTVLIVQVVYTVRKESNGEEIYQIISARKASPGERQRYAEAAY
jgi:uncharacterized protein